MDLDLLPDEVLCHILSFLTTKEAALTSILSKRWRNLFALVPNLHFDDSFFLHPEEGKRERDGILESFMGFVDRVMSLQGDSPIKKLSLKCKPGVDQVRLNLWICNVLRRGVLELDLSIDVEEDDELYFLPEEVFVSKTLVNLKLTSEFDVYWWVGSKGTFMPKLKSLRIYSERVFCDDKLEMLLPCFPVIEELHLAKMVWRDSDETVSSATLTKLVIDGVCLRNSKRISFDTPSLLSLSYFDVVAEDYPLVNMGKLEEARLSIVATEDQIKRIRAPDNVRLEDDVILKLSNVVKLMNGIQNVQELHLSPSSVELLSLCRESMPVFNNVKKLIIYCDEARGWQAMPVLLKNCPHLEKLYIEGLVHHVTDKCGDACDCIYRKDKGRSLKSCPVKLIKIRGFKGTMKEMNMIEHFLDYFPCLKDMEICIKENGRAKFDLTVSEHILDMIEEYKDLYSCNVKLLVSDKLSKKWLEEYETEEAEALRLTNAIFGKPLPFPPTF